MGYKDLREFIDRLEQEGELQRIKVEVDWDVEISAIMRRVLKMNGPACLFEKVKDSNYRVFSGGLFGHKRYGLAIGTSPDLRDILQKMLHALNNPTPPEMVTSGSCKENIDTGDNINLEKFAVPRWHELDGGRYIAKQGAVITKDPDTGIRNVSIIRQQMLGKNRVTLNPGHQSGIHLQKYMAMNKPMPFATAIGVPPEVVAVSVVNAPYGVDEFGLAGTLAGEPVPLVKCETVDLEVPATSEIVLEGEILPDQNSWDFEGPCGEFTGYFSSLEKEIKPAGNLTAVTYRDNPIYQGCKAGLPPDENTTLKEIGQTTGFSHALLKLGIPGIKEVYLTEMGGGTFTVVVSMSHHAYQGNVRQIIYAVFALVRDSKWVIVVDDDVDIYDQRQVEWAMTVRVQPHRDIIITDDNFSGVPMDPSIHPNIRQRPYTRSSKIGIDATTKFKGHDFGHMVIDSEEIQQKITRRWKEYGFK